MFLDDTYVAVCRRLFTCVCSPFVVIVSPKIVPCVVEGMCVSLILICALGLWKSGMI